MIASFDVIRNINTLKTTTASITTGKVHSGFVFGSGGTKMGILFGTAGTPATFEAAAQSIAATSNIGEGWLYLSSGSPGSVYYRGANAASWSRLVAS